MPILDHSSPKIADKTPFEAFHTQWAAHIVIDLNERLPEGFLAIPHTHLGEREVDVRTDSFLDDAEKERLKVLYQPQPPVETHAEFPVEFEIFVDYLNRGKYITVGIIEILSPSNKARPSARDSFMVEVIPLKYGTTFKRIFSQPDVFCQFVHDVLGITISIDRVYTEYEYPETIGFVKTRYDLFAEDEEQRVIVEIQNVKEEDFFERFLYYHIISLAEQVKGYDAYSFDRTVYTIVVLTSVPRDQSINFSVAVSDMNPIDEFNQKTEIYPHRLFFLTPRLINDKTPKGVKAWLELIADSLDSQIDENDYTSPLFKRIISDIERTTISPEEVSEIKDEAAWELAKTRFIREGREEGREEGHHEAVEKIALAMLERGVEVTLIAEVTGLNSEEIEKLKRIGE